MENGLLILGGVIVFCVFLLAFASNMQRIDERYKCEIEAMKRRHEGERAALDNYVTATRQWLDGEGDYATAAYAYQQYLVICGYVDAKSKQPPNP